MPEMPEHFQRRGPNERSAACVCGEINTRHCPVHGQGESAATVELEVASVEPWMKYEFSPGTSVQLGTRRYVVVGFHEERGTLEVEEATNARRDA